MPDAIRMMDHASGSITSIWANNPIAPIAVKAAKVREWPTLPINRGAHQHPMKNPTKCAEPKKPICCVLKFNSVADNTSNGPTPPLDSCIKITERNRAVNEINKRMIVTLRANIQQDREFSTQRSHFASFTIKKIELP
jgi:hypothetical protein